MRIAWGPAGPSDGIKGRRVAITGMGVLAPCGTGLEDFWDGLCQARPEGAARRVEGFDPVASCGPKLARQRDRFSLLALAAAQMALSDSRVSADPARAGVVMGSGIGGMITMEAQFDVSRSKGLDRISPSLVPTIMPNAPAATISAQIGWRGPSQTMATACASGAHAIAYGAELVATGRCQAVLAGGSEAILIPITLASFANMRVLSPSGRCRPFAAERDGIVLGEGAAVIVLEDWEAAWDRGAHVYAELAGVASTSDAYHITAPSPEGEGAAACMELALADAGVDPGDVGHINAHGTATKLNDAVEARAIAKVFGSPGPPVTSIKGVIGHTLGAAGAIEAVATVLALEKGLIPPTAGYGSPDPDVPLDVVAGAPRPWEPGPALSNSFGFGGHNGCLLFLPAVT
jgi:3-oxoacyl-[acyl-carrier-protein] synthase II